MKTILRLIASHNPVTFVMNIARWLKKAWAMLREIKTGEQHIHSVRSLLARELRANAYVSEKYPGHWAMQDVQGRLAFVRWHQYAAEWSILRKRNPDLWDAVADAYDALERTARDGASPPDAATLTALADRLDAATF